MPGQSAALDQRAVAGSVLDAVGAAGELSDDDFAEKELHDRLERKHPQYQPLLEAIRKYEGFARRLQDGCDVLRAEATARDVHGYVVTDIARDKDFAASVNRLQTRYETADRALGEAGATSASLQSLFHQRFQAFAEPSNRRMVHTSASRTATAPRLAILLLR